MANTAIMQRGLAKSEEFQRRVADALAIVAWQVVSEDPATPNHTIRLNYARVSVLPNLNSVAISVASWLVDRTNVLSANTTYDFNVEAVVSDVTDAALQSQLSSDWNIMAGV